MPLLALIITILAVILIIIAFFSIDERFHLTSRDSFNKKSVKGVFRNMFSPFKDKEYMKFLAANVTSQSSRMILGITFMPFLIFVIGFSGTQFYWYILINITAKYGWLFFWTKLLKRKRNLLKAYKINILVTVFASFLELILIIEMDFGFRIFYLILSYLTVIGATNSIGLFYSPIQMEIIDKAAEDKVLKDNSMDKNEAITRLSGAYFGLFSFSLNISTGIISLVYGFIYQGNNSRDPLTLTLAMASIGIYHLVAWFILKTMKLKFKSN